MGLNRAGVVTRSKYPISFPGLVSSRFSREPSFMSEAWERPGRVIPISSMGDATFNHAARGAGDEASKYHRTQRSPECFTHNSPMYKTFWK